LRFARLGLQSPELTWRYDAHVLAGVQAEQIVVPRDDPVPGTGDGRAQNMAIGRIPAQGLGKSYWFDQTASSLQKPLCPANLDKGRVAWSGMLLA